MAKTKIKSIRFKSEKNAKGFAKKVNGTFKDLRQYPDRKSDFKVTFVQTKGGNDWDTDWEWNEKNMDGSFAYNGVTDDF